MPSRVRVCPCPGCASHDGCCGHPTLQALHCPRCARPGFASRFRTPPGVPPGQRVYATSAWRRLSRRTVEAWVRRHGRVCPGWRRARHPSGKLAADHVVPLVLGGAPFDEGNVAVLCPSCNARKGLSQRRR